MSRVEERERSGGKRGHHGLDDASRVGIARRTAFSRKSEYGWAWPTLRFLDERPAAKEFTLENRGNERKAGFLNLIELPAACFRVVGFADVGAGACAVVLVERRPIVLHDVC